MGLGTFETRRVVWRGAAVTLGVGALLGAFPEAAAADDAYVDDDAAANTPPCALAQPCQSVQTGIFVAGAGDTIFVDGGTYNENLGLGGGKSLVQQDFNAADGDTQATLDGGASTAIQVPLGDAAGTIRGFEITSDAVGIGLEGPATVIGNTFDDPDAGTHVSLLEGSGGSAVTGNTFSDLAGDVDNQFGVTSGSSGSQMIAGNTFENLQTGVLIAAGDPTVSGNTFTGTRQGVDAGAAIGVINGDPDATIVGNDIHSPGPGAVKVGVLVANDAAATLRRNEIYDHTNGIRTNDSTGPVTLNGDVIAGSTSNGIAAVDTTPLPGDDEGDVDATNVTVFGNSTEISALRTHTSVDSSIVGAGGILASDSTCTITFSRGPSINAGNPTGCQDFQTTAAPQFVNPGADNYHLKPGSPMIDAGNPANPGFVLDLDGQPRAIAGTCGGTARRDIGADEFVPNCAPPPLPAGDGDPPETTLTKTPRNKVKTERRRKKVTLRFESDEPGSSFECQLEAIGKGKAGQVGDGTFEPCASPFRRKLRANRRYEFEARAIDAAGNTDPTPASDTWKVKRKRR